MVGLVLDFESNEEPETLSFRDGTNWRLWAA